MEFQKHHKITFWVLGLFIAGAIVSSIPNAIKFIKSKQQKPDYYAIEMSLKKPFPSIAKKYNAYADMFEQTEPVLVYGFTQGHLSNRLSEVFDKDFNKLVKKENIQFKIIPYKNWEITANVIKEKYIDNEATCSTVTKEQEQLESYLSFVTKCMTRACIVNTKNNKYILLDRDAEFIIKVLKGEIEIKK